MMVTNHSSAVDLGVMLGRVAVCFKAGQESYSDCVCRKDLSSAFWDRVWRDQGTRPD